LDRVRYVPGKIFDSAVASESFAIYVISSARSAHFSSSSDVSGHNLVAYRCIDWLGLVDAAIAIYRHERIYQARCYRSCNSFEGSLPVHRAR
jgi:hypothetical protein